MTPAEKVAEAMGRPLAAPRSGMSMINFDCPPSNPDEPYTPRSAAEHDEYDALVAAKQALDAAYIAMAKVADNVRGGSAQIEDHMIQLENMESTVSVFIMGMDT